MQQLDLNVLREMQAAHPLASKFNPPFAALVMTRDAWDLYRLTYGDSVVCSKEMERLHITVYLRHTMVQVRAKGAELADKGIYTRVVWDDDMNAIARGE